MSDFQATSRKQGDAFEFRCNQELLRLGYRLSGRVKLSSVGVEIDQCAFRDDEWLLIEFKGSENGNRPGLLRTDSMKKAIANGALLKGTEVSYPYWVITSHLPTCGQGKAMMGSALRLGYVDRFMDIQELEQQEVSSG